MFPRTLQIHFSLLLASSIRITARSLAEEAGRVVSKFIRNVDAAHVCSIAFLCAEPIITHQEKRETIEKEVYRIQRKREGADTSDYGASGTR